MTTVTQFIAEKKYLKEFCKISAQRSPLKRTKNLNKNWKILTSSTLYSLTSVQECWLCLQRTRERRKIKSILVTIFDITMAKLRCICAKLSAKSWNSDNNLVQVVAISKYQIICFFINSLSDSIDTFRSKIINSCVFSEIYIWSMTYVELYLYR